MAGPNALEVVREGVKDLVFYDHVKHPRQGQSTGIKAVSTAQRLAAERGYTSVLMVSNPRFISQPAYRLSERRRPVVGMIQRFDLQRWIEWAESYDELVARA
ncbi:hypothetical protein [Streptomyces sp. NPDC092307]|uniref:hypothetical protein n=1 Tax=Streptomyces sp. NPDC092307 TaxID=3366013 RepID=UPI0038163FAB